MATQHTPGPWWVRTREIGGEVVDCFVSANDVNGYPYDAEIMGDDEYHDGISRKLADATLIAAAPEMLGLLRKAEATISGSLSARGYVHGSCTDEWEPAAREEVRTLAILRAGLAHIGGAE